MIICSENLSFLISQTLYGESTGVRILRRLISMFQDFEYSDEREIIILGLKKQVIDEVKHANVYSRILESEYNASIYEPSNFWVFFMNLLINENDPFTIVCGIHLLVEPFNDLIIKTMLLPNMSGNNVSMLENILTDEQEHIELGRRICTYFKRNGNLSLQARLNSFSIVSRQFLRSQRHGFLNPKNNSEVKLTKEQSQEFLNSLIEIKQYWLN